MKVNHYITPSQRRKTRVRRKLLSKSDRPRVSVFRSNLHTYIQVIDDQIGKTVLAVNDLQVEMKKITAKMKKMETAKAVAEELATQMKKKKIDLVVFDRGNYRYHGRVKLIAETLREQGIKI